MRWILVTLLSVVASIDALPVGNPAAASLFPNGIITHGCTNPCSFWFPWTNDLHLRTGFYGDYVSERKLMRLYYRNRGGDDRSASLNSNALILVANTFDWVEVFGVVGAAHLQIASVAEQTQSLTFLDFHSSNCWSFGMRATGARFGNILLGGEAQYYRTEPNTESYTNLATGNVTYLTGMNRATYEEWQVGLGATAYIQTSEELSFAPYIAFNVSNVRGDLRDIRFQDGATTINLFDLTASKICGLAVGSSLILNRQVGLTVEGRFANETALYVTGQITW